MPIALLCADIDLLCAEVAPTNRQTYDQIVRRGGETAGRPVIPLHNCAQCFPAGKREAFAHAHLFAVAQDWCPDMDSCLLVNPGSPGQPLTVKIGGRQLVALQWHVCWSA